MGARMDGQPKGTLMTCQNILLIDPIYNPGTVPPNVSLGRIEAALSPMDKNIIVADFVAPDCEDNNLEYFKQKELAFFNEVLVKAASADLIYISSGHGNELKPYPMWPRIQRIAQLVKQRYPNRKIIVGGALVNLYKKSYNLSNDMLSGGWIDCLVEGHENNAIPLLGGRYSKVFDTGLSWDAWDIGKYPKFRSLMYHVGCQYRCDFCFEGKIFDKMANKESSEILLQTIEKAKSRDGISNFVIEDSTFMSYPDVYNILECLSDYNIEFSIYARISEILKNSKLVSKLRQAGCKSFIIGIETLSDELLKKHHKGLVTHQTRLALDIVKDNDVDVQGCFMLGFPDDTLDNMKKTVDFAVNEHMNGYRWHVYQPNFTNLDKRFYSKTQISALDHTRCQLNVPDHCLGDMIDANPEICMMDEHFLPRARNVLAGRTTELCALGYNGRFNYFDLLSVVQSLPKNMILNEERLYTDLFLKKQR